MATLLQEVPDHSNWKIGMLKVRGMPDETEKQSRMGKGGKIKVGQTRGSFRCR